jgi:hypothetical protein
MSQAQEPVAIVDRATGNPVAAILHKELDELEIIDAEIAWSPERLQKLRELRKNKVPASNLPQHVHWNWALKAVHTSGMLAYRSFGIEAAGKMQGLMIVGLGLIGKDARLDPDKGKPLVYVDFIETAPWNAKEFTSSPIYKGVGVRLIQAATRLSIDESFAGRVGLHTLPQSAGFYANACEMTSLGLDSNNLEYLELTGAKAAVLIKK